MFSQANLWRIRMPALSEALCLKHGGILAAFKANTCFEAVNIIMLFNHIRISTIIVK